MEAAGREQAAPASRVLPHLYIGGREAAEDAEFLRARNIGSVLSLCAADCPLAARRVICVPDSWDYDLAQHFAACAEFIEQQRRAGSVTLVHCRLGHSRSAAVVLAYLLLQGWTLRTAYRHLLQCHAPTNPNNGFFAQLQGLEQRLGLVEDGAASSLKQPPRRTRSYAKAYP